MSSSFKNSFLIIALLWSLIASSQQSDSTKAPSKFLSIVVSPEWTFRSLRSNEKSKELADLLDSTERARIATAFSLNFGYQANSHFRLLAGLQFSDQGERTKQTRTTETTRYKNHFYLLGLRCGLEYGVNKNNIRYYAAVSMLPNYLLASRASIQPINSDQSSTYSISKDYKTITLAAEVSAGLQCKVTETTQFIIAPYYRKSITTVTSGELKKFFFSTGLNIGFVHFF